MLLEERLRSLQEGSHAKHQIEQKNLVEGEKDPDKRRESLELLFRRLGRPFILAVREQRLHFANPRRRCSIAGSRKPALVVGEAAKALLFSSRKLEVIDSGQYERTVVRFSLGAVLGKLRTINLIML